MLTAGKILERSRELLRLYRAGAIGLPSLIADFDACIVQLEESDPVFAAVLRGHWGVLEENYAYALDQDPPESVQLSDPELADALESLQALVANERPIVP
jgi:hypothetical protein